MSCVVLAGEQLRATLPGCCDATATTSAAALLGAADADFVARFMQQARLEISCDDLFCMYFGGGLGGNGSGVVVSRFYGYCRC